MKNFMIDDAVLMDMGIEKQPEIVITDEVMMDIENYNTTSI